MELNNYKSVTPLKKKRKKVTASATLVLCILCLLIGVLCGKAASTRQSKEEVNKQISDLKFEHTIAITQLETEITTRDDEINRLKKELAEANNNLASTEQPEVTAPEVTPDDASEAEDNTPNNTEKKSGGFGKTLIVIILLIVIGGCIFVGVRIFMRRNDEYDDDDDEYDDEEYDDYDDDEYDDDEYDDEEYDEDDEFEDDEE